MKYSKRCLMAIYFLFCTSKFIYSFSSLKDAVQYAHDHDESVMSDNYNYLKPDFTKTYHRFMKSGLHSFIESLIFLKSSPDMLTSFKTSIKMLIERRRESGFLNRHVVGLNHLHADVIMIWGDLRGAFHSFVRGLELLHEQGILADDLTIIKPSYYIVLNANVLGDAPWNLELLKLIVELMLKNPQNVIYVKGYSEDRNGWTDQSLMSQIGVLLGTTGATFGFRSRVLEYQIFEQLITQFFTTLPLALYIDYVANSPESLHNLIRFSGGRLHIKDWDELFLGDFFARLSSSYQPIITQDIQYKQKTTVPIIMRSMIVSTGNVVDFEETNGLIEIEPIGSAIVWSIFSSPTDVYRIMNGFFYDAFVRIDLTKNIESMSMSLFNRDIRTKNPFISREKYLVASGKKISNMAMSRQNNSEEVVFGASLDLSKGLSAIGRSVRNGSASCIEREHRMAQSGGRLLRLLFFR